MRQQRKSIRAIAAALALTLGFAGTAVAADYPAKPVTIVIPFGAGGGSDSLVRMMQPAIEENLGSDVIPLNVPGAGSVTGSRRVLDADADGYEVLVNHTTLLTAIAGGKADFGVDDFDLVASGATMPLVVVVPASSPHKTLGDLIAAAKDTSTPTIAGVNIGALNHFAMGMIEAADADQAYRYVQTGGGAATTSALLGEHIDVGVLAAPEARGIIDSGDVRALAALTAGRIPYLPDLPTASEQGVNVEIGIEYSWYMPKGSPDIAKTAFASAIRKAMTDTDLTAALDERGISPSYYEGETAETRVHDLLTHLKTVAAGMN